MTRPEKPHSVLNAPGGVFLAVYVLIFPVLFAMVLLYSRDDLHLFTNAYHSGFLDVLMRYWTWLGDGLLQVVLVFLLLMVSFRYFFTALAAFGLGGISVQLLKRIIFSDIPCPLTYFETLGREDELYLVPGVEVYHWMSFPSGHTATAFAVFFSLALLTKSKIAQAGLFVLALGVGYSRIYLSQHFLMDIVAGSFLGLLAGWLSWRWIGGYRSDWMECSVINITR